MTSSWLQRTASIRNLLFCNGGDACTSLRVVVTDVQHLRSSFSSPCLASLRGSLINYCFRAAAAAAALETPDALFAQRGLEERWARLVENYDSYTVRVG